MAGDWIKMRVDLHSDPAVHRIVRILSAKRPHAMRTDCGQNADTVVGKLHRLWSWADQQTEDGRCELVDSEWLDAYVGCEGFAEAMQEVGWLVIRKSGTGIEFPNFEKHNGRGAKRRAAENRRKKNVRKMSAKRPHAMRTDCGPEKRREEKSKENTTYSLPPSPRKRGDSVTEIDVEIPPDFGSKLDEWIAYRKERRKPLTKASVSKIVAEWVPRGLEAFSDAVDHSIAQGWQGLFGREDRTRGSPTESPPDDDRWKFTDEEP